MTITDEIVTTDVDSLIKLVQSKKEVALQDAAKELQVPEVTVESWASFLEEEGILKFKYKFTKPYLVYEGKDDKIEEKKEVKPIFIGVKDEDEKVADLEAPEEDDIPEALKKKGFGTETVTIEEPEVSKVESVEADLSGLEPVLPGNKNVDSTDKVPEKKSKSPSKPGKIPANMNEKIVLVMEEMKAGNFDSAKALYEELKSQYDQLPAKYEEDRDKLVDQLVDVSKKLAVNLDAFNETEMRKKAGKIHIEIKKTYTLIRRRKFSEALKQFNEIRITFSELPIGFIENKAELHSDILTLHDQLNIRKTDFYLRVIKAKEKEIESLIRNATARLQKEDLLNAKKIYEQILAVQSSLPPGFMQRKIDINNNILPLHEEILEVSASILSTQTHSKAIRIRALIKRAYSLLKHKDLQSAEVVYIEAKRVFNTVATHALETKTSIQAELSQLDRILLKIKIKMASREFHDKLAKIHKLLGVAKSYIKRGSVDLAAAIYGESLEVYNALPDGFLEEKTKLKRQMLEVYKASVLESDKLLLSEVDESVKKGYEQLLELLICAHNNIKSENFKAFVKDAEYVNKVYEELPVGFVKKNLRILDEVVKLNAEVDLLEKTNLVKRLTLDKHRKYKDLLHEIYRIYDKLVKNAPEDKELFVYVKTMMAPYSAKLMNVATTKSKIGNEIKQHARDILREKEVSLVEKEDERISKALQRSKHRKLRSSLMQENRKLMKKFEADVLAAKEVDKSLHWERRDILAEHSNINQKKDELQQLRDLNKEILVERVKERKLKHEEDKKRARDEILKIQLEKLQQEEHERNIKILEEKEKKKIELEHLKKVELEREQKIRQLQESQVMAKRDKKEASKHKKALAALKKERLSLKKQADRLQKKKLSPAKLKTLSKLEDTDFELKLKLDKLLQNTETGLKPREIMKEHRVIGHENPVLEIPDTHDLMEKYSMEESDIFKEKADLPPPMRAEEVVAIDNEEKLELKEEDKYMDKFNVTQEGADILMQEGPEAVREMDQPKLSKLEKKQQEIENKLMMLDQGILFSKRRSK